jgi:hypothetical protein
VRGVWENCDENPYHHDRSGGDVKIPTGGTDKLPMYLVKCVANSNLPDHAISKAKSEFKFTAHETKLPIESNDEPSLYQAVNVNELTKSKSVKIISETIVDSNQFIDVPKFSQLNEFYDYFHDSNSQFKYQKVSFSVPESTVSSELKELITPEACGETGTSEGFNFFLNV